MTLRIEKEKNISVLGTFWPNVEQVYTSWQRRKEKQNSEDFLLITKQVFSHWNLENFSGEYGR